MVGLPTPSPHPLSEAVGGPPRAQAPASAGCIEGTRARRVSECSCLFHIAFNSQNAIYGYSVFCQLYVFISKGHNGAERYLEHSNASYW